MVPSHPPIQDSPAFSALASLAPVHEDHGEKGDIWGNCLEKSCERRTARHRTNFPGTPAVFTADFQAQKGCKKGFAIGHVAVAHWIFPKAFSIALREKAFPSSSSLSSFKTATCFSLAIWTNGPEGFITNPNQVLIPERTVFFQLSGVPKARRTPSSAGVSHDALDALRTQQKSSTKTNPQSTSGNSA